MGRDDNRHLVPGPRREISIHSPRVGRDISNDRLVSLVPIFQSTRPAWGETVDSVEFLIPKEFQSTRPAWGETVPAHPFALVIKFQSTRPAWGET